MPDWSYRTLLRPLLIRLGPERARLLSVRTLRTLSQVPLGLAAIDFLGHMRPDQRLRRSAAGLEFAGPIALGALIDPAGEALPSFGRFGCGLIETGPVAMEPRPCSPRWKLDLKARRITGGASAEISPGEMERNLARCGELPVCVRISERDVSSIRRIVEMLEAQATMFSIDATTVDEAHSRVAAARGRRPVLLRVEAAAADVNELARAAIDAGASGIWIASDDIDRSSAVAASLRTSLPTTTLIIAGGVTEPRDVHRLLNSGADLASVDAGLVVSGPGLIKRCNEALLASSPRVALEPFTLDAARSAWFWALLLGIAMFAGGVLALIIASTRVVLPYDESLCGMTRAQLASLNPRLLPFMAHDRVSLAGTMLSIGIFYAALAWCGIRRGSHWAHVTVIVSTTVGFLTFFLFLGFGYFDPFHAFVTGILTQFSLLCLVMKPSSPQPPPAAQWTESAEWRRGLWGQLLFIAMGFGLVTAGIVMTIIGCTHVFVDTDLAFMRTTAATLRVSYDTLVPLVAHDRASLGGMLIANGIAIWLAAQWGMRAGERWLWTAFAWGGNMAFACATAVHVVVGYDAPLHLAPALAGWIVWNIALLLTRKWLTAKAQVARGASS